MLVFWRHGYETTSIGDLTTAMVITATSLYRAFGDKKRLFLEAAQRYAGGLDAMARSIDGAPAALDAARRMLTGVATGYTREATPNGCLLASATASGSAASADAQGAITDIRQQIGMHLRARIERDISAGVLSPRTHAAALAGMVMAIIQGLSVLAIVEQTLQAWPAQSRAAAKQ